MVSCSKSMTGSSRQKVLGKFRTPSRSTSPDIDFKWVRQKLNILETETAMIKPMAIFSEIEKSKLVKRRMPHKIEPMLATLTEEYFSDPDWVFERKLDGERCIIFKNRDDVHLMSRNGQDISATYPELVNSVRSKIVKTCIMDGEIVAFKKGRTSLSRLRQRMDIVNPTPELQKKVAVYLYLFDMLYLEGYQMTALPLRSRKRALRQALGYVDPLRYTVHRNEKGTAFYRKACENGWEGIIAKDGEAPYEHRRSRKWLKFKCEHRQEFVIGGWTDPKGERQGFGALLIGYYEDGELVYAGKVGSGFSNTTLLSLHKKLKELERNSSLFDRGEEFTCCVHHVDPELVVDIGFSAWTKAGRLRHPHYIGLGRGKAAKQVHRERS